MSYPPGVTQQQIDYYAGGYDEPPDDDLEDDYDPGEGCGRWVNGRLGKVYDCRLAGTEFCDFECPYRD